VAISAVTEPAVAINCTFRIAGNRAFLEGDCPIDDVRDATSYFASGYRFSPAYRRKKWDGKIHLFNLKTMSMPAGLVQTVVAALLELDEKAQITVVDTRISATPVVHANKAAFTLEGIEFGKGKYDYQLAAATAAIDAGRGILKLATNAGKSEVAVAVIKYLGLPTVFLVPGVDLLHQTRKRFALRLGVPLNEIGAIGDGLFIVGKLVTIATVDTLHSRQDEPEVKNLLEVVWQVVFVDECFPAGTLIGNRTIESIKVGDTVDSFDEKRGSFVKKKVVKLFKSVPHAMVQVRVGDRTISCTAGHPFFTQNGWKAAAALTCSDYVLYTSLHEEHSVRALPNQYPICINKQEPHSILPFMSHRSARGTSETCDTSMCLVHQPNRVGRAATAPGKAPSVLFNSMLHAMEAQAQIGHGETNSTKVRSSVFRAYEKEQSYAKSSRASKTKSIIAANELETSNSWRKRATATDPRVTAVVCTGLGHCSDPNKNASDIRLPNKLQNRHRQQRVKDCHRSGRWLPLHEGAANTGQEEGRLSSWVRVDSVTILKQGSDHTFGGVCPDGYVYNFEVEDTHTYVANGFVVHNCHGAGSDTFYDVLDVMTAYFRYGMSGTPLDRSDGANLRLIAQTGEVLYEVSNRELIACGVSVPAHVEIKRIEEPKTTDGHYKTAHTKAVVQNDFLNGDIEQWVPEQVAKGLQVVILIREIAHGAALEKRLRKHVPASLFISGEEETSTRVQALEDLSSGKLRCLIGTSILYQGIDAPNIDVLVFADLGKSKIAVLQAIGRGLRQRHGKERLLVRDYANFCHKWFTKHSLKRLQMYKAEKCFSMSVVP